MATLEVESHNADYANVLGRWLDYLQTGALDAIVQLVLTHCDIAYECDKQVSE